MRKLILAALLTACGEQQPTTATSAPNEITPAADAVGVQNTPKGEGPVVVVARVDRAPPAVSISKEPTPPVVVMVDPPVLNTFNSGYASCRAPGAYIESGLQFEVVVETMASNYHVGNVRIFNGTSTQEVVFAGLEGDYSTPATGPGWAMYAPVMLPKEGGGHWVLYYGTRTDGTRFVSFGTDSWVQTFIACN